MFRGEKTKRERSAAGDEIIGFRAREVDENALQERPLGAREAAAKQTKIVSLRFEEFLEPPLNMVKAPRGATAIRRVRDASRAGRKMADSALGCPATTMRNGEFDW